MKRADGAFNLSLDAIIADWQAVPAMADVVRQAKEMLQAAGGDTAESNR